MKSLKLIRYALWASVVALGGLVAALLLQPQPERQAGGGGRIGGRFVLASQTGETVDSATLAGRPYAVFFGFTQCPDVCPTTMFELSERLRGLGDRAKDVRVFFITVDPERDTTDLLRDYLTAFDPRIVGLRPTLEQLPDLARQFAAVYVKVPTASGYTMNHTSSVFLFDRRGAFAGTIDMRESVETQTAKLERLIAG